jgi:hypothetical protein
MRKENIRETQPTLAGGTQTVMGGKTEVANKDSLTGKNVVKEYKPGKLPMGGGALGGKPKAL